MANGPKPEMAENGHCNEKTGPKMGFWPFFGHFSISAAISGLGPFDHFLSHFLGIFVSGRFPILHVATSIDIVMASCRGLKA